ncbi:MAG: hypothetical protein CL918_06055 [Deltaproteobacteria bacterium]|jgi:hypothetical protein|nr:hypothetical protein [Deltaproteobacteria bacterium]MDP6319624.1 hypothetical protein [SAR324 cluster bacterium]RZO44328.1 MAG: hypothetical protein EVA81_06645 [Pseudomonadota bacterium]MDC0224083.1 hypothetical protein [Deltaproteobacteria bacterium]MDC0246431.1 hypothetical protein [Deltaproteobacteria bacterium]|tara:strand:- start:1083 stop:1316 length:234 start_codon:yes stop_codon:yes gene_type:complete
MLNDISSITQMLEEMVEHQQVKVLKVARGIIPDATPEDIRNPQDFPELSSDSLFNYEDGILTGYLSLQIALRNLNKA